MGHHFNASKAYRRILSIRGDKRNKCIKEIRIKESRNGGGDSGRREIKEERMERDVRVVLVKDTERQSYPLSADSCI